MLRREFRIQKAVFIEDKHAAHFIFIIYEMSINYRFILRLASLTYQLA